jgi:hypothetical protein
MTLTKNFTSFGLRKLEVAAIPTAPATTPTWIPVPLIEQAEFKLDVKEQELWGDDVYQGTFYHSATGKITAKANRTSLRIFEMLSGVNGSSTGGTQKLYFGTDKELLPPRVLVRAEMRGRDGDTGAETIDRVYWYQAEVKTVYANLGGARAKIQEVNLEFNTFSSIQDEQGNPIDPAVGGRAFGHREVVNA